MLNYDPNLGMRGFVEPDTTSALASVHTLYNIIHAKLTTLTVPQDVLWTLRQLIACPEVENCLGV